MEVYQMNMLSIPGFFYEIDKEQFQFKILDLENIKYCLPKLFPEQLEDVLDVEERFFGKKQKGKLLTNVTGTGKTYVGLGVATRFQLMDKNDILIVVPTDEKCKDWIDEGEQLDLEIYQLQGINDYQPGIIVTTYANYYQNEAILTKSPHLIIYDEAHYLLQNAKGTETVYLEKHKRISNLSSSFKQLFNSDPDYYKSLSEEKLTNLFENHVGSTKVLMLSASPFAYVKALVLGDGCLWNINESDNVKDLLHTEYFGGYNQPDYYENFFMENFGYRMKNNKLTIPEYGVDLNLMERTFYEKQKKLGAISGRQIQVPFDYSREFVLINSTIGNEIDKGLDVMQSKDFSDKYPYLSVYFKRKWKFHYTRQLLENIKAKISIPRIVKHLKLNRKVVVFHDYNHSVLTHPFHFNAEDLINQSNETEVLQRQSLALDIKRFEKNYPGLINLDLSDLINPIDLFKKTFGEEVGFYNGDVPKRKRSQFKRDFNSDYSFVNIILVQRKAGKEGISLHDTTGLKQRVLVELGLPTAPTDAIQVEGRIYRIKVLSNAIYEYLTIQTNFERYTYSQTIAERSRTAENLALGEAARNMELVFKEGYQNYTEDDPNENQGTGGVEADKSLDQTTEFQKAISFYYGITKKNSKTKSQEGTDYFSTPEPLGYKMVEWLYALPGDRILEPSAGHGAIGRFFSPLTENTFVEQSNMLSSKLRLNIENGKVYEMDFESLHHINKFDKIVMNPPFGHSGKTAMLHFEKALNHHLYKDFKYQRFTRLIAIVPVAVGVEKRLLEMDESKDYLKHFVSYEILLPACTFERAGTKVNCKIIVVDKKSTANIETYKTTFYTNEKKRIIDLRGCATINDFFEQIEHLELTNYNE